MCSQFNADELTLFHAVKAAFDPSGLLNPGKNIPTLHRCAEFGRMHIHNGQLPFPNWSVSDVRNRQRRQRAVAGPGQPGACRQHAAAHPGQRQQSFLGRQADGVLLDTREHRGIVSYDPTELVVTVRAGTPLTELEAALDAAGQMLPCEPPHFAEAPPSAA